MLAIIGSYRIMTIKANNVIVGRGIGELPIIDKSPSSHVIFDSVNVYGEVKNDINKVFWGDAGIIYPDANCLY